MLDIPKLSDKQLIAVYDNYNAMLLKRWEASAHPKFKKMEFPPSGNAFNNLFNEIKSEIKKRKINV